MADNKAQQPEKKKVHSKRYDKYKDGKATQPFCPKCGPGIFLAAHKDRRTCGKCGYMEKL